MDALPPLPPPVTFLAVLTTVLRLTENQANALIEEGYDSARELCFWNSGDITTWCANKTKLPATRGGCTYGNPRVKAIQAFAFWATDMHQRGLPLALAQFDDDMLLKYKEMVRVETARKSLDSSVQLPAQLGTTSIWEDWENSLQNYLQSKDGINGIPLSYIIRPTARPDAGDDATEEQIRLLDLIHNAPSEGPAYNTDSEQVFGIIESLTIGQDSANWISRRCRQNRDGRLAMSQLKDHFDGGEEKYKRNQTAIAQLNHLHYKHEKMMSFNTFSTRLKKCFDTIAICDQAYSESTKIDMLLRRIKSSSADLATVVTMIRTDTDKYNTFIKATQELAKHVAILFPLDSFNGSGKHPHKRKINATRTGGGGGSHKIVTKNGKKYCNGVDVTDQLRSFSSKEWRSLPYSFKKELYNNPDRKKSKKSNTDRGVSDITTAAGTLDNDTIGRIVSGVTRATLTQADTAAPGTITIPRPPRMGAGGATQRQTAATETNPSSASVITNDTRWDHNGNVINN